jgi:hypothetical protein
VPTLAVARFGADATGFAGLIGLTSVEKSVSENDGSVALDVRRTGGSAGEVSVSFETVDVTATAGSDYSRESGQLVWADGDASVKTITLKLIDDANAESAESFLIELSDVTGGAELAASSASISVSGDGDGLTPLPPSPPGPSQDAGGGGSDGWLLGLLLLALSVSAARSVSSTSRDG